MNNKITKIISNIVTAFVTWKFSDVIMELTYDIIDASIVDSGNNVSNLLIAMRAIVGLLAFDGVSFVIVLIRALVYYRMITTCNFI